jgi:LacI family transcriptional regulator
MSSSSSLTIEHIAELAQVSRSTVSRVLNDHPSVRAEVRDRVLRVIGEQGYTPQAAARSLASKRTNTLGLLIPRSAAIIFSDPFFGQVIQGMTEASSKRGYFLSLSMVTASMEQDFYRRVLRSRSIDGLLMVSSDIDDPILPLLITDNLPLMVIGEHPYLKLINWIDSENQDGARQAINHLVGLGHRRIAMITGFLQMNAAIDRFNGYKQALLEAGIAVDNNLIAYGDYTQESGYIGMKQLLEVNPRPTAVFTGNDMMGLGALRAIHEAGLEVPADISIVGFDDVPMAAYANPPLTTMRQPIAEMGALAANTLIDQLENIAQPGAHIRLPTQLVVRQSSGPARS